MQIYKENNVEKVNVQLNVVKRRLIFSSKVIHFYKFEPEFKK